MQLCTDSHGNNVRNYVLHITINNAKVTIVVLV